MKKIYFLFILLFTFACTKSTIKTKYQQLNNFYKIEVNGSFNVVLIKDTVNKLEIICDDKIIDDIIFSVTQNTLILSEEIKTKWLKPKIETPIIKIHYTDVSEMVVNQTSNVTTENAIKQDYFGIVLKSKANAANLNLDCKNFYYWNNYPSGGKLTLTGKATELNIWNAAIMSVDASALISQKALVENNSKADCIINVADSLKYTISNAGNIINVTIPNAIETLNHDGNGQLILP